MQMLNKTIKLQHLKACPDMSNPPTQMPGVIAFVAPLKGRFLGSGFLRSWMIIIIATNYAMQRIMQRPCTEK